MATRFRIRRSTMFNGAQNTISVAYSELAYVSTNANNYTTGVGRKLYIGAGTLASEVAGQASAIECIGGSYYTQLLDSVAGTLTPTSAIITDANSRINTLNIGAAGAVNYFNTANTFSVGLQAPNALAANYAITLPSTVGTTNQFLQTDGTGITTWASIPTPTNVTLIPASTTAYQLSDGANVYLNINDVSGSENITIGNNLTTQSTVVKPNTAAAYRITDGTLTYFNIDTTTATPLTTIDTGNVKVTNALEVSSGTITTTATTANIVNDVATTVNIGGAATSVAIGAVSGTTTVNNNLTVVGNLIVQGGTSQVETTNLSVRDALIDLGKINNAAPTTNTGLDLGIRLNYFDTTAKVASLFYKNASGRFVLATNATEATGNLTVAVPTATTNDYAQIEAGALYINDFACNTLGTAEPVISYRAAGALYAGSLAGRYIDGNVIIDGGQF